MGMHELEKNSPAWAWIMQWLALMSAFTLVLAIALGMFTNGDDPTRLEMTPDIPACPAPRHAKAPSP